MAASSVVTVRIDPALLAGLKAKAARAGRTVSAEIVRLVKAEVQPVPVRRTSRRPTMGMFPDLEAPDLEEFQHMRRELSTRLLRSVRGRR